VVRAVDDVSFCVPHSTFVGLTGESGSGKTTIALSLLALSKGAPGTVGGQLYFEGKLIYDADLLSRLSPLERAGQIAAAVAPLRGRDLFMIFQEPRASLNPYWKVEAQLAECLRRRGRTPSADDLRERLNSLLKAVNLPSNVLGMFPAELSTGMCQRVMIAMALAMDVKLLVADEPLSRIDLRLRQKVVKALEAIRAQRKMAMLLTTHDLALLRRLADMVAVLYKGKVVEIGPTEKVIGLGPGPRHEYTKRLLEAQRLMAGAEDREDLDIPFLKGLRKLIALGRKLKEVEKGHWIRV